MHLPYRWGNLQFSSAPVNSTPFTGDPLWPQRLALRTVYDQMCAYNAVTGYYTTDVSQLTNLPAWVIDGCVAAQCCYSSVACSDKNEWYCGW